MVKSLQPGRIVVIYIFKYKYVPALILKMSSQWLTVFLLCNEGDDSEDSIQNLVDVTEIELNKVNIFERFEEVHFPCPPLKHAIVNIPLKFLIDVTDEIVKIDSSKIIDDYKKRQLPRFR